MSTSRSDEKGQVNDLDWKALFQDPADAGSPHLVGSILAASSSVLFASSGQKIPDPRMTQSQGEKPAHRYTVTITPPAESIDAELPSRFSLKGKTLFSDAHRASPVVIKKEEKIAFLKAHFPSLFIRGSLITNPVIIMKDNAEHKDYEEWLRQQPTDEGRAAYNRNGYLVVNHVSMKKCIDKLLELSLEQLQSRDIKDIFDGILEDTIGELEPFKSDDDIVLTESGHSYLSAPLSQSLEIKQVDPNTNQALKNTKLVKDMPVKRFLEELDQLVELNKKSQCNRSR